MGQAQPLFTFYKYFHFIKKAQGRHGIHSPFVYNFMENVILPSKRTSDAKIERIRNNLKKNSNQIELIDQKENKIVRRTISSIVRTSSSNRRFSSFLQLLANEVNAEKILETGTSFGLNALYLAKSNAREIHTIEGNPDISKIAQKNFESLNDTKISLHTGQLQDIMKRVIQDNQPDMVFLDADHRSEALFLCLNMLAPYLKKIKVIIMHDIYWSRDMHEGWIRVIDSSQYPLTIDIFEAGLIFPNFKGVKQHFTLKF